MTDWDPNTIDEQLRNVAVPAEALARLREIAAYSDREVDHTLGDVPTPAGVMSRLRKIGTLLDSDLDGEMRHVGVPGGVIVRLRRTVRRQILRPRLVQLAVAAALVFVVVGIYWVNSEPQKPASGTIAIHEPDNSNGGGHHDIKTVIPDPNKDGHVTNVVENKIDKGHNEIPDNPAPKPTPLVVVPTPPKPQPLPPGFNANEVLGNLPAQPAEFSVASGLLPRGIAPPRVKGYDWQFLFKWGVQPFVEPSRAQALRESRVPIWTDTASFDLADRLLQSRRVPLPAELSQIRAEDFLAAMDYGFPVAANEVAIRTAAAQDPWGQSISGAWGNIGLMQVGVQAGQFKRGLDFGTHLTLCIDASSAMGAAGRWDAVRTALAELAATLDPRDRVSLVLFNDHAVELLRQADRKSLEEAVAKLDEIQPRGLGNLEEALAAAVKLAEQASIVAADGFLIPPEMIGKKRSARLLFVTSGLLHLDDTAAGQVKKLLTGAVDKQTSFQTLCVRSGGVADAQLESFAAIGGRPIQHVATLQDLTWQLRDAAIGRSETVASGVSMKVTFTDAVASYRLVGHEPSAGGLSSGPLERDLRSGEAATALYQVELKPDGGDIVANIEITWSEPSASTQVHHVHQAISRQQFAPSWSETPLSLQLAALAADTAEILRGSPFAPLGPRALDSLADLAQRANPALQLRPSFVQLKSLIDRARALHVTSASAHTSS